MLICEAGVHEAMGQHMNEEWHGTSQASNKITETNRTHLGPVWHAE
jgi:hypothetical protein